MLSKFWECFFSFKRNLRIIEIGLINYYSWEYFYKKKLTKSKFWYLQCLRISEQIFGAFSVWNWDPWYNSTAILPTIPWPVFRGGLKGGGAWGLDAPLIKSGKMEIFNEKIIWKNIRQKWYKILSYLLSLNKKLPFIRVCTVFILFNTLVFALKVKHT